MNRYDLILIAMGLVMGIAIGFLTGTSYAMSAQDEVQCRIVVQGDAPVCFDTN